MFHLKKNNLYLKFNLLIVGSIFISGIIMATIFLYSTSNSLRNNLFDTARQTAETLSGSISDDILLDNQFGLAEQILRVKNQNSNIRYIIVADSNQKIISSTFLGKYPSGLPLHLDMENTQIVEKTYSSNESLIDEVIYPINKGKIGYVRIGMSEVGIDNLLKQRILQIFSMVFLVCVLGSGLATYYAWRILQPISQISTAIAQIGTNKQVPAINIKRNDEIGRLGNAFSLMIERLNRKNKENTYLLNALKQKEETRKWLISQLFNAREDECKRISRELHDESGQSMISILAYLRLLKDKLTTKEQLTLLEEVRDITALTIESIRRLAVNLHPPLLEELGLIVAIKKYIDSCQAINNKITIDFNYDGDFTNIDDNIAIVCYRTMQEGMNNILRHSKATKVLIEIISLPKEVALIIKDNGIGFDEKIAEKAKLDRHLGLVSMKERVELLNGAFQVESTIGKGTYVTIVLPK